MEFLILRLNAASVNGSWWWWWDEKTLYSTLGDNRLTCNISSVLPNIKVRQVKSNGKVWTSQQQQLTRIFYEKQGGHFWRKSSWKLVALTIKCIPLQKHFTPQSINKLYKEQTMLGSLFGLVFKRLEVFWNILLFGNLCNVWQSLQCLPMFAMFDNVCNVWQSLLA